MSDSEIQLIYNPASFGRELSVAEKEGLENLLGSKSAQYNDETFCQNFPNDVRKFISTIIQTSLYRVYENGIHGSESDRDNDLYANRDQCNLEAYYLIDQSLQEELSFAAQGNEDAWHANAKLEEFPQIPPNIVWPTNENFTRELGLKKIEQYIGSWQLSICWRHFIHAYPSLNDPFCKKYRYRVQYSIPTRRTPVPRQSVSVYFTLVVSKIKPKSKQVDVFYVVESFRFVHRPGANFFNEEWLKDLLNFKSKLAESITY